MLTRSLAIVTSARREHDYRARASGYGSLSLDLDAREGCSVPAELYSVPLSGEGVGAFVRPGGREWAFHITIAVTTMLLAVAHASSL